MKEDEKFKGTGCFGGRPGPCISGQLLDCVEHDLVMSIKRALVYVYLDIDDNYFYHFSLSFVAVHTI